MLVDQGLATAADTASTTEAASTTDTPTTTEVTTTRTYQDCAAHIVFFDIESMGHAWPMPEAKGPGSAWIAEDEEVVDHLEEAFQLD